MVKNIKSQEGSDGGKDLFLKPLNEARSSHKRDQLSITRFRTAAFPGIGKDKKMTLSSTSLNLQKHSPQSLA